MHTYIVIFTLLTFYSVAVSAGLQEVLIVAKCTADIYQELPKSCVFITNSEGVEQGENKLVFSQHKRCGSERKYAVDFVSSVAENEPGNTIFELINIGKLWE
jgi:hypothetical protein